MKEISDTGWYIGSDWDEEEKRKMRRFQEYAAKEGITLEELLPKVAIHEAGHAIMRLLYGTPLRCCALGWVEGDGKDSPCSKEQMQDISCAGVAAELIFFGEYTKGYYVDLGQFQNIHGIMAMLLGPDEAKEDQFFAHCRNLTAKLLPFKPMLKELADLILVSRVEGERLDTWRQSFNQWREENGV